MKIKKIIKNTFLCCLFGLFINQVGGAISWSLINSVYHGPNLKTDKKKIAEYVNVPKSFVTVDYLNLANFIVHHHSDPIRIKKAKCLQYSNRTYEIYKQLIKQNNRSDLSNKIRLVTGIDDEIAHIFLEFKHNGKIRVYETCTNTPELEIEKIKNYSKKTLDIKQKLNLNQNYHIISKGMWGIRILQPSIESFFYDGIIQSLTKKISYRIKQNRKTGKK